MLALDAFRGAASAVVLVYHYMHFVYAGHADAVAFAPALKGLYLHGWLGVDSFFCLSGFIFGRLYGDRIATRAISARGFFVARLSRLYPMFLATLLPCTLLLMLYTRQSGATFLHQNHDTATAFVAELFLVRQWFSEFLAFNRSAWSISIEVLMYLLFYLSRRAFPRYSLLVPLGFVLLAFVVRNSAYMPVVRGLFGFFLGVVALEALRRLETVRQGRLLGRALFAAAMVAALVGCTRAIQWSHEDWNYGTIFCADLGFAALIAWASRIQVRGQRLAAFCAYAGELSYPAYLIHVPLQIAIILGANHLGMVAPAGHAWFFGVYMALVLGIAAWAHRAYEIPTRRWLRQRLLPSTAPVAAA